MTAQLLPVPTGVQLQEHYHCLRYTYQSFELLLYRLQFVLVLLVVHKPVSYLTQLPLYQYAY